MTDEPLPKAIQRTFRDLSDAEVADIEKASLLARAGFRGSLGWEDLLRSERVLIVSEAGVGKTHETKAQRDRLWAAVEPAFYLDLSTLATSSVREMLSAEQEERLDAWLRSQSEIATFFLASIDELKLSLALQLHFVLGSESIGPHDSRDYRWSEHRLRRRLGFGRRRCGM